MALIVDAGPLLSLADQDDPLQASVERALRSERGPLILPAPVTAEVDYLVGERVGPASRRAFLNDLAAGRFTVECLAADDYAVVADLERRYADLDISLADLSIVVLAARFRTRRILTFDERDFRSVRPLQGGAFTLLPADRE